jgi:aspartate aminotransferase
METTFTKAPLKVSKMASGLQGSEIIKLAGEINELIKKGKKIYNLTIGDFDPAIFPIPRELKSLIKKAYDANQTNYPPANGMPALRTSVAAFIKNNMGLDYHVDDYLITGGARPLIYALYQTLIDENDKVVFPVPSWNNNHYTHLSHGQQVFVETKPENNFMPVLNELKAHLADATLLALCSPLNPTGTVFTAEQLKEITDAVVEENAKRTEGQKPLYILYDQIYWTLTYGDNKHYNPVSLNPDARPYTIFIDGLSKAFAATGVRIGWAFGPSEIISKMKSIIGHIGAWAPKAEQVATAEYLSNHYVTTEFLDHLKEELHFRLDGLYKGLLAMKEKGYPVDVVKPAASLYLTVKIDLVDKTKADGETIKNTADTSAFLLENAGIAIVPFSAFGASKTSSWFRVSVGTCNRDEISSIIQALTNAIDTLKK